MSNSLWHLAGQMYCVLRRSRKEVTAGTIANEDLLLEALSDNEGLVRAYKRCPKQAREKIQVLLCDVYPYGSGSLLSESWAKVDEELLNVRTLYNLCELYSPEEVEKHIRYSFSRSGYGKALTEGKIQRNPLLQGQVFSLMETSVLFVHPVATHVDKLLQLLPTSEEQTTTEKQLLKRQAELQGQIRASVANAEVERMQKRKAAEEKRIEREKEITRLQGEIKALQAGVTVDIETIQIDLNRKIEVAEEELAELVQGIRRTKLSGKLRLYSEFIEMLSENSAPIAKKLVGIIEADIKELHGEPIHNQIFVDHGAPLSSVDELNKVIKKNSNANAVLQTAHQQGNRDAVQTKVKEIYEQHKENYNHFRSFMGWSRRIKIPSFSFPSFLSLSFNADDIARADEKELPRIKARIGVSIITESASAVFPGPPQENFKDNIERDAKRILAIVYDSIVQDSYDYLTKAKWVYDVDLEQPKSAYENKERKLELQLQRFLQTRSGADDSIFANATLAEIDASLYEFFAIDKWTINVASPHAELITGTVPLQVEESANKENRGLRESAAILGIGLLSAAAITAGAKLGAMVYRWWTKRPFSYKIVEVLMSFVNSLAHKWQEPFYKWYLDNLEREKFQAVTRYVIDRTYSAGPWDAFRDSGFTVVNTVSDIELRTTQRGDIPKPEEILRLSQKSGSLKSGIQVAILYFQKQHGYWILLSTEVTHPLSPREVAKATYTYYRLNNAEFLYALGAREETFFDLFLAENPAFVQDHETVQSLIAALTTAKQNREAKKLADAAKIPDETVQEIQKTVQESLKSEGSSLVEEDQPTSYVTTKELEASPKPGEIQTPDGTVISKAQAQQLLGQMLVNLGNQTLQGTSGAKEEKPEEVPSEETPEEETPEEVTMEETPEEETTEEEETPEGEKEEETEEEEEEETEEEKKKKEESVRRSRISREINIKRMLGLKKELPRRNFLGKTVTETDLSRLRMIGRYTPPEKTELMNVISSMRATGLHPLVPSFLGSTTIVQALGSNMRRQALREALKSSQGYPPEAVGYALGQILATPNQGDFLFEQEDMEDISVLAMEEPVEEFIEEPMPGEAEAAEVMQGTEVVINAEKVASAEVEITPENEIDQVKQALLGDDIARGYIDTGDTEALLARAREVLSWAEESVLVAAVSELMNQTPNPEVSAEVVAQEIAPGTEVPPETSIPSTELTEPKIAYPAEGPELEISIEAPLSVEEPPEVEVNYATPESEEVYPYEGVLMMKRGTLCEVALSDRMQKFSTGRLRVLPSGSSLASCLRALEKGKPLREVARRRLYSRALAVPLKNLSEFRLDDRAKFLLVYTPRMVESLLHVVGEYKGFLSDNVAVFPLRLLNEVQRKDLGQDLAKLNFRFYSVCSRTALKANPQFALSEQLDVPEGAEGNEIAKSFQDGNEILKMAQKALIDFEGVAGKIVSLASLEDKGKKTRRAVEDLSDEVKDSLDALKEVMKQFSEAHEMFSQEFPDAKVEEPEEAPAEPEPTPEPAPAAAPETSVEPPAPETKEEKVAERLLRQFPIADFLGERKFEELQRLVLYEDASLTPDEVTQVMQYLCSKV